MPFQVYDKYESIPEGMGRENFRQGTDGKWYPQVADDHPLVKKKQELLAGHSSLTSEKAELEKKVVPSGHRIVPLADFTLLELIKQMNLTGEQIKTRLIEYPILKKKETQAARESSYETAGKFLKYGNLEAFKTALKLSNVEVTFKPETVDGAQIQVPYVGDAKLSDYIANTPDLKTMEPFFKVTVVQTAPRTEAGAGTRPAANSTNPANLSPTDGKDAPTPTFRFNEKNDVAWE